ncbi:4-coumarate--CoA ligase, partial [Coemansia sp. RSA 522]
MIFESKLPNINVPDINLAQFVLDECKSRTQAHDAVFVDSETNESITVEQLELFVHGFANGLRKCGINEGDVVATVAGNSQARAVCTPANPSYTPRELAHQLTNAQCKAIVVGDGMLDTVTQALDLLEYPIDHILALDESRTNGPTSIFRMLTNTAPAFTPVDHSSAAYLCYSSGTTGKPKGVILTHANMIANAMQINGLKQLDIGT